MSQQESFAWLLRLLTESAAVFRVGRRRLTGKKSVRYCCFPKFSHRVVELILDYTGWIRSDGAAMCLLAGETDHLACCRAVYAAVATDVEPVADVVEVSYGWHPEQLTAAEYNAHIVREISANLDFMAEARGRPRPGLLHPDAAEDEKANDAVAADPVEGEWHEPDSRHTELSEAEDAPLRPELRYKPVVKVGVNDLHGIVHRLNVAHGPGRKSASNKRSVEFVSQFAAKYAEIQQPRACIPGDASMAVDPPTRGALSAQKTEQERRKAREEQLAMESDADDCDQVVGVPDEVTAVMAVQTWMEDTSPAAYALRLVQQRLPAPVLEGQFAVPKDQYEAVMLAVAPLHKLWLKAGEVGLRAAFGKPDRLGELLALVTPVARRGHGSVTVWMKCYPKPETL